jgi:hypothetical protein
VAGLEASLKWAQVFILNSGREKFFLNGAILGMRKEEINVKSQQAVEKLLI